MKILFDISVNRYYSMTDAELESEASRWKIHSYGNSSGSIERQIIIDALLKKDSANNSRYAIFISLVAMIISIISIIIR